MVSVSPLSCSNCQCDVKNKQVKNTKNSQASFRTDVSFKGIENKNESSQKSSFYSMLETAKKSVNAVRNSVKSYIDVQKEKREFDKIFKIWTAPHFYGINDAKTSPADVTVNGHLIELGPSPWSQLETRYLENENLLREWAFNVVRDYKESGMDIKEFATRYDYPHNVELLLNAYEAPRKITVHDLLTKEEQKINEKKIDIKIVDTKCYEPNERHSYYLDKLEGTINGAKFELLGANHLYWPTDESKFVKWATKHINNYKKSGLLPYKYAEIYGEDKYGVKLLLWAYEDGKENSAKEIIKEKINKNTGLSKERIDAILNSVPKKYHAKALQAILEKCEADKTAKEAFATKSPHTQKFGAMLFASELAGGLEAAVKSSVLNEMGVNLVYGRNSYQGADPLLGYKFKGNLYPTVKNLDCSALDYPSAAMDIIIKQITTTHSLPRVITEKELLDNNKSIDFLYEK